MPWTDHTPVERHLCAGREVLVKRDDLYATPPAPPLAKLRGVRVHLAGGSGMVGVYDTRVSKAGWGVAAVCAEMGRPVYAYYPRLIAEGNTLRPAQANAARLGAVLMPLAAGRTAICYARARADCQRRGGTMLPLGLVLAETVAAVAIEAARTFEEVDPGCIVVSVGTGMILAGLLAAAAGRPVFGVSAGMDPTRVRRRIEATTGRPVPPCAIEASGDYYTPATGSGPFPMHPYYDLKAWRWLEAQTALPSPILFWNIGA